jgi:hypothetical protein
VGGPIADWLVTDFVVLGIHIQHWMIVFLIIVVLGILITWATGGFDDRN